MGALCLLGVTRKVKISYLLCGHSHTLGDGIMGALGSSLVDDNLPTFEVFRTHVKDAGKNLGYAYIGCFQLLGITDYKLMFDDIQANPHSIHGK